MTQNSQPLPLEEALQQLFATIAPIAQIERGVLRDSLHRILADDVASAVDLPPFPASAMDGYALRRADFEQDPQRKFEVIGESLAGHPGRQSIDRGQCMRIFTGAAVPDGADQVILQEEVADQGDDWVQFTSHAPPESYVRPIGHDIGAGQILAHQGAAISALVCGALTAAGIVEVDLVRRPVIGVFSTGDELVDPGDALQPGQIFDSNRATVIGLLQQGPWQVRDLGRLPDDQAAVRNALGRAASQCDALLTSGGVSVGDADFVTDAIRTVGSLEFWRLNLKPGKPLAFGRIEDCYIFGLPGNPVSTIVTLLLLVRPALMRLGGGVAQSALRVPARLLDDLGHSPGRTEFQRGVMQQDGDGLSVRGTGDQSSNRMSTFRNANCLIEIPADSGNLATGETVQILPFWGLLS